MLPTRSRTEILSSSNVVDTLTASPQLPNQEGYPNINHISENLHYMDKFKQDITELFNAGVTQAQILVELQLKGCSTSIISLRRRLEMWGLRRRTNLQETPELLDTVRDCYLYKKLSDSQIAAKIASDTGTSPTARQIRSIRIKLRLLGREDI